MKAANYATPTTAPLIFGALQKPLFIRIASICGLLCNIGFLLFVDHGPVISATFVGMISTGMALYLSAFVLSELFKKDDLSIIVLLCSMDLMFFFGLVDQRFQFFTIILSPLIPSFTLLLLGYRTGSIWFYIFLFIDLVLTFLPLLPIQPIHVLFGFLGTPSALSFTLPILLGILNISGFAVLFQRYLENSASLIKTQVEEITRLSMTDPLTLIYNRRAFLKLLESEFARAKRIAWRIESRNKKDMRVGGVDENLGHLSVLLFDVDFFKKINDAYGHPTGDIVLTTVGDILQNRNLLRETDCAARFGGEEFIIFEPDTSIEGALLSAERIRAYIEAQSFVSETGVTFSVTVSCGISERDIADANIEEVISRADKALYQSKAQGRNRCTLYSPPN